jgi:hypothetical protein
VITGADLNGCVGTVDHELVPVHHVGGRRGEEDGGTDDVARLRQAARGERRQEALENCGSSSR